MRSDWLRYTILRAASLVAPGDQRSEWLEGWRSELWYIPRRGATPFCLGAFRDALWLRRNNPGSVKRTHTYLESPLSCLAFLAILAAVGLLIAILLPAPKRGPWPSHISARELPAGCIAMLLLTCLLLPSARFAMGRAPASPHPAPWPNRLRLGIFLGLKIALVQPIMLGGFVVLMVAGSFLPMAAQLVIFSFWFLAFRWVLMDQQRRCPVCLRLLTDPVRIGTPSQTFLAWYGSEAMCSRGHGLLHISEMPPGYSENPEWLTLDDSLRVLFTGAAGVRQR